MRASRKRGKKKEREILGLFVFHGSHYFSHSPAKIFTSKFGIICWPASGLFSSYMDDGFAEPRRPILFRGPNCGMGGALPELGRRLQFRGPISRIARPFFFRSPLGSLKPRFIFCGPFTVKATPKVVFLVVVEQQGME